MRDLKTLDLDTYIAVKMCVTAIDKDNQNVTIIKIFRQLIGMGEYASLSLTFIKELILEEDKRRMRGDIIVVGDSEFERLKTLGLQELKILMLLGQGITSKNICKRLQITDDTLTSHKTHITRKLGLGSNSDLPNFAFRIFTYK